MLFSRRPGPATALLVIVICASVSKAARADDVATLRAPAHAWHEGERTASPWGVMLPLDSVAAARARSYTGALESLSFHPVPTSGQWLSFRGVF